MADPVLRKSCHNRDVVNVDRRLFSYKYDAEGGKLIDPWEIDSLESSYAMCFYAVCGPDSYNGWVNATDSYINGTSDSQLRGHYDAIRKRISAKYSGAALPTWVTDALAAVQNVIDDWNDAGYRADKTMSDNFRHPTGLYWMGQIKQIVDHFDDAACAFDDLNDLAVKVDERSATRPASPTPSLEDVPENGIFGGGGGEKPKAARNDIGLFIGIAAAAAAGYLGYKVLTE
jgi:hypothetical protein